MSYDFAEDLHLDGIMYALYAFPLNAFLSSLPTRLRLRGWPGCSNGYRATWTVADCGAGRQLYLTGLSSPEVDTLAQLLGRPQGPLAASWFSGMLRATRGPRRRTGYPPRSFSDDEVYLEIVAGAVLHEWVLDLRAVPDQTDDELRLSLPRFLWGPRLLREST